MNKSFVLLGALIIVLIGVLTAFLLYSAPVAPTSSEGLEDPFTLSDPFASSQSRGSTQVSDRVPENAATKKIKEEITKTFSPQMDGQNKFYEITASETATSTPFIIYYFEEDRSVQVILYEQPIGKTRRLAENELLSKYSLSEQDACTLTYQVTVPMSVDEEYYGTNLGFSFCPGSVVLTEI